MMKAIKQFPKEQFCYRAQQPIPGLILLICMEKVPGLQSTSYTLCQMYLLHLWEKLTGKCIG